MNVQAVTADWVARRGAMAAAAQHEWPENWQLHFLRWSVHHFAAHGIAFIGSLHGTMLTRFTLLSTFS